MFKLTELDGKLVRVFYKKIEVNGHIVFAAGKTEIFEKKQPVKPVGKTNLDKAA